MKKLLVATVAVLVLGAFTTPSFADRDGVPGGPNGEGRTADAASHDNAHGGSANANDIAGVGTGGTNGKGNDGR